MRNQSICFLSHPFHRGGVTRWMIDAAEEFLRRGWKTWFVTVNPVNFISGKNRPPIRTLLENLPGLELIAPDVDRYFELGTLKRRSIKYAIQLIDHVPAGVPVILSDDESIWLAGSLVMNNYPVIGVLHSDDEVYYNLLRKYKHRLAGVVAVSQRIKQKAVRVYPGGAISVYPCGIPLPEPDRKKTDDILKIIWVGRIEERQKRVSDIPRIAELLKKSGVSFIWTIAGHGDERPLKEKITLLKLDDHFRFTGWINRETLYELLDESDILVLTSNFEGMPVVVMEALSKGVGVVSTKVSGVEDLSGGDPESAGALLLYEIGNIEEGVSAIIKLSKIEGNRRLTASRRLAEKYFSIQACIDGYVSVISGLSYKKRFTVKYHKLKLRLFFEILISSIISRLRYLKYTIQAQK